jgi:POT family proton-dependent oligopeptide transporter
MAQTQSRPEQRGLPLETYMLLGAVVLVVVLYRAAYEQVGNSIALWADTGIDRHVGSHVIPMTWFQSLNSLLIFMLSPFVIWYWTHRARRGREPGDVFKMALGGLTSAASYLLIAAVAWWSSSNGTQASWLWLVLWFFIYTLGELFILPVGLGLFGRMAPPGFAATAIAAWFLAAFAGNFASGVLGAFWGTMSPAAFFALTAGVAGLSGALLLALAPWSLRVQQHREPIESGRVAVGS